MQENIQDWFELDEGDHGFLLLTEERTAAVIFFYLHLSALLLLLHFPFIYSPSICCVLGLYFATFLIIG
jgi:hypothetical protein